MRCGGFALASVLALTTIVSALALAPLNRDGALHPVFAPALKPTAPAPHSDDASLLEASTEARPRDRMNRAHRAAAKSHARTHPTGGVSSATERAISAAKARAAAITAAANRAAHAPVLQRPANAPHPPRPPTPPRHLNSKTLTHGSGHPRSRHPPAQHPHRFQSAQTQAEAAAIAANQGKTGAKTKDFVWTQEGQWHGLGEEEAEPLQPPWADGPDPLPKHVAEPFTPPKAPTMGFQGDGRFYPPPPPPPPPPPSPYPPPPPPPPPGGAGDPEAERFVEKSAHVHVAGSSRGAAVKGVKPDWIPSLDTLPANSPQFPFHLFPTPAGGNPPELTNLRAGATPLPAGPGQPNAPSTLPNAPHAAAGGFDPSLTAQFQQSASPGRALPSARANAGFGVPAAPAAATDPNVDNFGEFMSKLSSARHGGPESREQQLADERAAAEQRFEAEMEAGEREQMERAAAAAALAQQQQQQQHPMEEADEPQTAAFGI